MCKHDLEQSLNKTEAAPEVRDQLTNTMAMHSADSLEAFLNENPMAIKAFSGRNYYC
jgi:hypothetical protein